MEKMIAMQLMWAAWFRSVGLFYSQYARFYLELADDLGAKCRRDS